MFAANTDPVQTYVLMWQVDTGAPVGLVEYSTQTRELAVSLSIYQLQNVLSNKCMYLWSF